MSSFAERLSNIFVPQEPPIPASILGERAADFAAIPAGETVCIKVSAAHALPYPFAVSGTFTGRVIGEILAVNPELKIVITEGGVGGQPVLESAKRHGLDMIPGATFLDAEASEPVFVPNPNPTPYQSDGFWFPQHWLEAHTRILLTTCKLRIHHYRRVMSGGTRNLIGLLPRAHYKLSASRREMRSLMHQQGMDAMTADLYTTAGQNVLTVLDCRLLARQDEHFPMRFANSTGQIVVADDPFQADMQMAQILRLPYLPPYLAMIAKTGCVAGKPSPSSIP